MRKDVIELTEGLYMQSHRGESTGETDALQETCSWGRRCQ